MWSSNNYVTNEMLTSTGIAMITVVSLFLIARSIARWYKVWSFQVEDGFMLAAYIFFMAMSICYLDITNRLFHLLAVVNGEDPLYPNIITDTVTVTKFFFANTNLLWATLWSVKFSFLFLYRRLMKGLPGHLRWWWAIVVFCIVVMPFSLKSNLIYPLMPQKTFIGCVISSITSCSSMYAWFTPGQYNFPQL
jgi:hypothetical protein